MSIRPFLDKEPLFGNNSYIDPSAVVIGDVVMGDDCSIWPASVVRGDVHKIRIGDRTNIQDGSVLHVTHYSEYKPEGSPLIIGDDVTMGHRVIAHACAIGNRCLLGMGSTILDDVVIEDDVFLGAGSLVLPGKTLESGYLWLGSPAKKIRALTDEELVFLRYSAAHYVKLKDQYLGGVK